MDKSLMIQSGKTALGIEFGSTRVKAVLIGEDFVPLASGGYEWENKLEGGYWTYSLDEVHTALRSSFKALKADVKEKYGCDFVTTESEGSISEDIFERGLCLPSDIKNTKEDMELIIKIVRSFFQ